MGWLFTQNQTKKELVNRLVETYHNKELNYTSTCVKHSLVGNHLWAVFTVIDENTGITKQTYIKLFLLASERGYGYGYKDMSESAHPYYYDCPISLLKLAPVACEEWRQGVIERHKQKSKKIAFKVGDKIALKGSSVKAVTLLNQLGKDKFLSHDDFGRRWKITRKFLIDAELIAG